MNILRKLEELALVILSIYLFSLLPYAWWMLAVLFFAPDISLLGLLVSKRAGAIWYDLFHHRVVAVSLYLIGSLVNAPFLALIGVVLLGHGSFDRCIGLELMDPYSPAVQHPSAIISA